MVLYTFKSTQTVATREVGASSPEQAMAETTTVRISTRAQRTLKRLSKVTGRSQTALLDEAVEELRRRRFFEEANRAYVALKADPKAWAEELEERKAWEATLGDGQDD